MNTIPVHYEHHLSVRIGTIIPLIHGKISEAVATVNRSPSIRPQDLDARA